MANIFDKGCRLCSHSWKVNINFYFIIFSTEITGKVTLIKFMVFNTFSPWCDPYQKEYILFILRVIWESPSIKDEMWWSICIVFTAYSNNCSIFNWSQAVWHWLLWPRYWTSNNCVKAFNLFYQERDNSANGMWGGEKNQQPPAIINKWTWIVTRRHFLFNFQSECNRICFDSSMGAHFTLYIKKWLMTSNKS